MREEKLKEKIKLIGELRFFFGRRANRLLREDSGLSKQAINQWMRNEIKRSSKIEKAAERLVEQEKLRRIDALESEKTAIAAFLRK
jgi:hypothetical protein